MITGAHTIIYSRNAQADRKFFREILKFSSVDVGDGWLIFGLPPSEVALHPSKKNDEHEFYLLCDDIEGFVAKMRRRRIRCSRVRNMGWGLLSELTLPGGGRVGVYEPKHKRPRVMYPRVKFKGRG